MWNSTTQYYNNNWLIIKIMCIVILLGPKIEYFNVRLIKIRIICNTILNILMQKYWFWINYNNVIYYVDRFIIGYGKLGLLIYYKYNLYEKYSS